MPQDLWVSTGATLAEELSDRVADKVCGSASRGEKRDIGEDDGAEKHLWSLLAHWKR
jgi:hypothetical protein